ncbi:glucose-6-phosphate dehydrogenase assembly protein OpcA [Streptomyces sp. XM4193]|uniref:glucose-6-phosphate dehydrogenase assembly protein OpcA n=1 Tax=Streptomyces sp. XM4193 TaxID=2929782 RepID=UPI001FFA5DAB|nr:glucose-6-phosphate dehydrogenase assembly protein OpcA [Streptomyces sp. XM4193]MCK1796483.1 glucose-6-phosphate dehydrogenase assembly protein OpcA [Streptomyces sp. XM4193]
MNTNLTDTTSSQINAALVRTRRAAGFPAVGMVLTLVIVTDEGNHYDALRAASDASKEHPSRILVVIRRPGRSPRARARAQLDAEVRMGGETGTGETVLLRLHGELAAHAYSVVLPLLLPDAPVVVWWPEDAPVNPAEDLLGTLAQRRITDAAASEDPVAALETRAKSYAPGDTDLAWTRVTPWRSVLAAALDQKHGPISEAVVEGEAYNPSTELLALWLAARLGVPVDRVVSEGPGITAVRLGTPEGQICLDRPDERLAELAVPGQPDRHVALHRRTTAELIAEELRRLDPDETYQEALCFGLDRLGPAASAPGTGSQTGSGDTQTGAGTPTGTGSRTGSGDTQSESGAGGQERVESRAELSAESSGKSGAAGSGRAKSAGAAGRGRKEAGS